MRGGAGLPGLGWLPWLRCPGGQSWQRGRTHFTTCMPARLPTCLPAHPPCPRPARPFCRHHLLPALPRPAQLRPAQAGGEPDPLPPPPLLHGRLRAPHLPRQPAVPLPHRARADAADVGRQEHDVRGRPPPRPLPHRLRRLPRPHVLQGRWGCLAGCLVGWCVVRAAYAAQCDGS